MEAEVNKDNDVQHTCPITLDPIPQKYDVSLDLGDPPKTFHYDVRGLLDYVEKNKDAVDPMTRITYSTKQKQHIRDVALIADLHPLSRITLRRLWNLDDLFRMIKTQICYSTMDDLYGRMDQFLSQSTNLLRSIDERASEPENVEIWLDIKRQAIQMVGRLTSAWQRLQEDERQRLQESESESESDDDDDDDDVKEEKGEQSGEQRSEELGEQRIEQKTIGYFITDLPDYNLFDSKSTPSNGEEGPSSNTTHQIMMDRFFTVLISSTSTQASSGSGSSDSHVSN